MRSLLAAQAVEVLFMAVPYRSLRCTYFLTFRTCNKAPLFRSVKLAGLLCQTLFRLRDAGRFTLHAFVVMPDHVHLLITVPRGLSLERVMQLIKGGFSLDAHRRFNTGRPMWRRGFERRRIHNATECERYQRSIHENPLRGRLVESAEAYAFSSLNPVYALDELPLDAIRSVRLVS
jgi:putative transposase